MELSETFKAVEIPGTVNANPHPPWVTLLPQAGLGSETPHDERGIRSVGGQNSDTRPDDIELAEEAKESEVIKGKSNLGSVVPRSPALHKQY